MTINNVSNTNYANVQTVQKNREGMKAQFEAALTKAGINLDDFKDAVKEAKEKGCKPGSDEFNSIMGQHGIDVDKLPKPPQGGTKPAAGMASAQPDQNNKSVIDTLLSSLGIDKDKLQGTLNEAKQKNLKPFSEEFNTLLENNGIDSSALKNALFQAKHESLNVTA